MKKLLLLFIGFILFQTVLSQPAGLLNETFRLKSLSIGNSYLTPNGENPTITMTGQAGDFSVEAVGISNTLFSEATFGGNSVTFNVDSVTQEDCTGSTCYFEDLYFFDLLTTTSLDSKTFTYYYSEDNGFKFLRLRDEYNNWGHFSTEPAPVATPLLFKTWYLFMTEGDMGDPIFYNGPNPPQITIYPDFTYTGIESCATISGDFILGYGEEYLFPLQPQNFANDESNCGPGEAEYALWELTNTNILETVVYQGNDGNYYLSWESNPGFLSHFWDVPPLSTPENNWTTIKIYPNPVQNILVIKSSFNSFDTVIITDINGRIVLKKNSVSNEIDVSALKSGMYFITLQSSEGKITKKFIKN